MAPEPFLAVRRMTSAILILPMPMALPVRPVVLPDGEDPSHFTVTDIAYTGPGTLFNSRDWDGLDSEAWKKRRLQRLARRVPVPARQPIAYAIGACRGSAIGAARSRSFIVHLVVRCPSQKMTCLSPCQTMLISVPTVTRLPTTPTWKHTTCPNCGDAAEREQGHV